MGKASRRKVQGGPPAEAHQESHVPQPDLRTSPTAALLSDALVGALGLIAGLSWIGAHAQTGWAGLLGVLYLVTGVALGAIRPIAGLILAVATVPFTGVPLPWGGGDFGAFEGMRSVPIWGATARIAWSRLRGNDEALSKPPIAMFIAASVAIILAPITRLTAQQYQGNDPTGIPTDMFGIFGTQSAMWAAWIVSSHLPSKNISALRLAFAGATTVGIVLALAGWLGIPGPDFLTFKAEVFGRLAALGYPTPTGMGLAIALPIATAALWQYRRSAAIALVTAGIAAIVLTESRGALLAVLAGTLGSMLIARSVPRRWIVGIAAIGGAVLVTLLAVRYGDQLMGIASGKLPDLKGDSYRVQSWVAAVQIAIESPLVGGGWSSIGRFDDSYFFKRGLRVSHNTILQGLSDGGFPLGVAVAVVVIGATALMWKNRKRIRPEFVAAAIATVICGAWDIPQLRAYAALMGGIALGLVSRRVPSEVRETQGTSPRSER
jgi:hypothetical protein